MWLIYALGSALFSGATSVLAKCGAQKIDSRLTVALRSVVILAFAWATVLITGSYADIGRVGAKALIFPLLSGITNSLSWMCYFRALRMSAVNRVAAVDKAGITLTIVGGWLILGEPMTGTKIASCVLILIGAWLMVEKTQTSEETKDDAAIEGAPKAAQNGKKAQSWLFWAIISALLTAATTILSKMGVARLDSDLGFAIRTGVMFILSWSAVVYNGSHRTIKQIDRKAMLFIALSGLTTASAWLCYFRALASPNAQAGIVQPIDKLSILVSVLLAGVIFKEKLSRRSAVGLIVLTVGILILLI